MRWIAFKCKLLITCFKRDGLNIRRRSFIFKSGLSLTGIVTLIPNVSAQAEAKDLDVNNISNEFGEQIDSENTSGWERLKSVYQKDKYGRLSKELTATIQTSCVACFAGLLYGGVQSSRVAFRDFMERNQASVFENHLDAKKRLQNHVTIHFGKGAFRWGVRLAVFNAGFMLAVTSLLAYRGHTSIVDYMVGGTISGSLLRLQLGPRAALVGGALGCFLGGCCGAATKGLFYMSGYSLDDMLSFQYDIDQSRLRLFRENEAKEYDKILQGGALNLLKSHESEQSKKVEEKP